MSKNEITKKVMVEKIPQFAFYWEYWDVKQQNVHLRIASSVISDSETKERLVFSVMSRLQDR